MKKILFLIHDLGHGGAEKVLVNLVNNLNKNAYSVTVMALFGGGVNEQFLDKDVHLINCFNRTIRGNTHIMKLFTPKHLHKYLIKDHFDIEIAYLEGACARIVSGCSDPDTKKVCWIHSMLHDRDMAAGTFRNFSEADKCYKSFDQIVCVAETVKKNFDKLFDSKDRSMVLYNTNESEKIRKFAGESIEDGLFNGDETNIIGIGKVDAVKGFDRLARALNDLSGDKQFMDHKPHVYILGKGEQQQEIEEYLKEKGIVDMFTFLGYKTNPYKYLAHSDLFVCASHSEGFSTAATEALICGIPVLTTDVSGMREMLGETDAGLITENSDKGLIEGLRQIICDGRLRTRAEAAKKRGELFSTSYTVNAVEKMFEVL